MLFILKYCVCFPKCSFRVFLLTHLISSILFPNSSLTSLVSSYSIIPYIFHALLHLIHLYPPLDHVLSLRIGTWYCSNAFRIVCPLPLSSLLSTILETTLRIYPPFFCFGHGVVLWEFFFFPFISLYLTLGSVCACYISYSSMTSCYLILFYALLT